MSQSTFTHDMYNEKSPDYLFRKASSSTSFFNTQPKIEGHFALQQTWKHPDDNVDKIGCEVFRVIPKGVSEKIYKHFPRKSP